MTLYQCHFHSIRPYPWHPLSVSMSLFTIVAVGLGWCWKECSEQTIVKMAFKKCFVNSAMLPLQMDEFDSFVLLFLVKAFFNADC